MTEIPRVPAKSTRDSIEILIEIRGAGQYKSLGLVNQGKLYLTGKRLIFEGTSKNSTLPFERILKISTAAQGVTIHKDKGKDPVLKLLKEQEEFAIILDRLKKSYVD